MLHAADRPAVHLGRGPLASERTLKNMLARELTDLGPAALARPVYLLVPSHSLRNHILRQLAHQHVGLAGVGCFTLRGLAREVLERAGESAAEGGWMLPVLVRRAARSRASLRSCLDHLRDGYRTLLGTVSDLLDAGLDPAHGSAFDEVLAEEGRLVASVAEVQRARSLVQVAIDVAEEMETLGLGHVSSLLQRATEILRTDADLCLPSSGFHVYGFADATGVATDLIEATLQRFGGRIYLDHPPDPAEPLTADSSFEFSRRFATRLTDLGSPSPDASTASEPPTIDLVAALGMQAEVREIGWRIRRQLDAGAVPERIGVVARQLGPYRQALRTHFARLGIPFSAERAGGPLLPAGRRIHALLEVLVRRRQVRLERWLEARASTTDTVPEFDLRLAMFGLGVSRLEELAALPIEDLVPHDTVALPVRLGFAAEEADSTTRLPRRRVPTAELYRSRAQALEVCELFDSWAGSRPLADHLQRFGQFLELFGWRGPDPTTTEVRRRVFQLAQGTPATLELDLEEMAEVVAEALAGAGTERFGGLGGGVQMLDVTEARARTFDHLFVLGMNKGIFPRSIREDPALPDSLRGVLGREGHGVLPDLPRKRSGFAEERFLFAQLCAASPQVTLSWQLADDDSRELNPSPLVERLLWSRTAHRVASPMAPDADHDPRERPRTLFESAVRVGLVGQPRQVKAALSAALPRDLSPPTGILAEARLGIVRELDRPPGVDSRLGPFFGFLGAASDPADPRVAHDLYVTTCERFATCPWQTFLERLLRLEALPDPVEILPRLDPVLTGQVVHRVLERLVRQHFNQVPITLDEARTASPAVVGWPAASDLEPLIRREAHAVASAQGISWPGFAAVLARIASPFLEQAHRLDWQDPAEPRPVAAELGGSLEIGAAENQRRLHFQADRVDLEGNRLRLSDYKTGRRALSRAVTEKTRAKHLIDSIRQGRWLQAAAYARAAGDAEDQGRYVFLHPDFDGPEGTRIVTVDATDEAAQQAFDDAMSKILDAWMAGCFFPRLVEPDDDRQPTACDYCGVAEACLRGDSAARGRLRDWSAQRRTQTATEDSFLQAWRLASKRESRP